jgi:malate synthase
MNDLTTQKVHHTSTSTSQRTMIKPETPPSLLWSCISRNDVILAEAGADAGKDEAAVVLTAQQLIKKKPTPGWEFHSHWGKKLKAMKFHVYDNTSDGDFFVWSFSCVYSSERIDAKQVQAFVEKIVGISEMFREHDDTWKYGYTLAAQDTFAPILKQRMEEVTYMGKMAMVNEQVDELSSIMSRNIEMILARGDKIETLQEDATRLQQMAGVFKKNTKKVKRKMMWQNAKHGLVLGSAITAGVAIVVIPPLVAIL